MLALVLEAIRDPGRLRAVLGRAAAAGIPVVLLTAGSSAGGRAMVSAHSGALAAADGGWEALAAAYGVHRVGDLAELTDTLELFAIGRRAVLPARPGAAAGIATVHDSGLERAHVADVADELGVPFGAISPATRDRLAGLLDPGLAPENPLDMWGTGAHAREQLAGSLAALASDPAVAAVALAVDLVHEFDGDQSYPLAVLDAAQLTSKPVTVLSNIPSAIDPDVAAGLRAAGVPVLEGTRSGLLALRHLLDHARRQAAGPPPAGAGVPPADPARRDRWAPVVAAGQARGARLLDLLRDYGIAAARVRAADSRDSGPGRGRRDRLPGRAQDRRTGDRAQVGRARRGARHPGPGHPGRRLPGPGRAAGLPGCWCARRSARAPSCRWAWPGTATWARWW